MALQFQQPFQIRQAPTNTEAFVAGVQPAISTLPEQWDLYKQRRLEQQMKLTEMRSKYGTGLPSSSEKETPEDKLKRLGTEAFGKLNPQQYGSYIIGPDGKPQLLQFPEGVKPGPAIPAPTPVLDSSGKQVGMTSGKPTILPKPDNTEEKLTSKLSAEKPKALGSLQNTLREYDNMIAGAEAIKNDESLPSATGLFGGKMKLTTGQRRVAANLDTLKAKTLLNVLGSLKDLSKNGSSGFGQLSELEGENIRNSISSLDRSQGTPDFQASIDRFINEMQARKQTLQDTFSQTYGEGPKQDSGGGLPSIGDMFQGHKVLSVKRVK